MDQTERKRRPTWQDRVAEAGTLCSIVDNSPAFRLINAKRTLRAEGAVRREAEFRYQQLWRRTPFEPRMKREIEAGELTREKLRGLSGKELVQRYGVSRYTAARARKVVLENSPSMRWRDRESTRAIGLGVCGLVLLFLAFTGGFGPPEGDDVGTGLAMGGIFCLGAAVVRVVRERQRHCVAAHRRPDNVATPRRIELKTQLAVERPRPGDLRHAARPPALSRYVRAGAVAPELARFPVNLERLPEPDRQNPPQRDWIGSSTSSASPPRRNPGTPCSRGARSVGPKRAVLRGQDGQVVYQFAGPRCQGHAQCWR